MKDIIYRPVKWEDYDLTLDSCYEDWKNIYDHNKNTRQSRQMFLYRLVCEKLARDFFLSNFYQGAEECLRARIDINEAYIKKLNSKKHKRMTDIQLKKEILSANGNIIHSKWLLEEIGYKELYDNSIQYHQFRLQNTTKKSIAKRERNHLIICYIMTEEFKKARELNKIQFTGKLTKLKVEDIYKRDKFFHILTEYLIDPIAYKDYEQPIKDCFMYFFDELLKGNESIYEYDELGGEAFIEDMPCIWYKYFSEIPFEQVKPADIIKCRRYGIIGIHCDKTE